MTQHSMFRSVLIANRGEIAVRIVRAARDAGIGTVAVYAEADAGSPHVQLADDSYALRGESPAETYLDAEQLISVALRSGAEAVHPGYGFLSENAAFARAVQAAGLIWIGPDPDTIELLGDKDRARALAAEVGAPLAEGGRASHADDVHAFAQAHGFPLIIKAVHGGGGRGMRVVRSFDEIASAHEAAVREAAAVFGTGDCLVERYLERPRHIEVQVLGDRHGRLVVLGTRDCSLQRRHQKLVEEAPAPFLDESQRDLLHASAERICRAAGYVGAGTVEFLLAADGTLSFLEVNTRLQVEHGVTEEVTGVDLVQEQFRVAAGLALELPDTVAEFGHAVEFRINAEDPALGFLPTPGTIDRFEVPGGVGVRVDSGVRAGQTVPGTFDSLLAKLIVRGRDRHQALVRARRALAEFEVSGVATVIPFHRAVLDAPDFTAGEQGVEHRFAVHTGWVEEEQLPLDAAPAVPHPDRARMRRFPIEIDGRLVDVGIPPEVLGSLGASVGGNDSAAHAHSETDDADPELLSSDSELRAPFAGVLTTWSIAHGAEVQSGQVVAVLEAMKMEVPLRAGASGTLAHEAELGSTVAVGARIARIETGKGR